MIDTVAAHLAAGRVTARNHTRSDDLLLAADWCEAYELDDTDDAEQMQQLANVARFLRSQAARRKS